MACGLTSCSTPRYEGKAESQQVLSACESAYYSAEDATDIASAAGSYPFALRYPAARTAATQWIEVASQCADRFEEGTIRASQAEYTASMLAGRLGLDAADPFADFRTGAGLADIDTLDVGTTTLNAMALAEDRAGFIVEILTARDSAGTSGATLALSDNHKSTAERLISLAGTDAADDPRQKVYDVTQLLADPESIIDPATGLTAPTFAVAEINCAREELAAVAGDAGDAAESRADSLRTLARLIASRVVIAFEAGYPASDHALFQ